MALKGPWQPRNREGAPWKHSIRSTIRNPCFFGFTPAETPLSSGRNRPATVSGHMRPTYIA